MKKMFYILGMIIFGSCSQKIIPNKPIPGQFGEAPIAKESTLEIPISIPIQDINKYIESAIPQTIFSGVEKGKDTMKVNLYFGDVAREYGWDVKYTVLKNGKISFNVDKDGSILFKMPLKIDAIGSAYINIGTDIRKSGKSSPEIDLLIKTKLIVNPNWTITSKTTIAYDMKKAQLIIPFQLGDFPLFSMKLNIKDDLQKPIDGQLTNIAAQVDKYIAKYMADLKIQEQAAKSWKEYSTSMNISKDPPLYMNIQPKRVMFEDLHNDNSKLAASFGIAAILSVSSKPEKIEVSPLPKIENVKFNDFSEFYIPIKYEFDSLSMYMEKQYKDTTLVGDGYTLTINGIKIFGSGKNIIVDLNYTAKIKGVFKKVKGNMYFKTLPAFDIKTNTFYLQDCQTTSETNSLLTDKGMKWVANKMISKELMKVSKYCIKDDLENYRKLINDYIKSTKMGQFELNGEIVRIDFEGFYVQEDQIFIYFKGIGRIKTKILLLN